MAEKRSSRSHLGRLLRGVCAVLACVTLLLPGPADALTSGERAWMKLVKQVQYGFAAFGDVGRVANGTRQPIINFTVEGTPPSIFLNYVVPDDLADDLAAAIPLPAAFSLAKVRILESDTEAHYWVSLNVYRVSGITSGLRAEWSTYVDDGSGEPRFMIVQARTGNGSLDPVDLFTSPEPFQHAVHGATVDTLMPGLFQSSIVLPAEAARDFAVPTRDWVAANDFIYWRNGINDRAFYNARAHAASMIVIDPADVTVDDDTRWHAFVEPEPAHVLVYLNPLEFSIAPWWNVTAPDGRVPEGLRRERAALKQAMYGGMTFATAFQILFGTAEPIVQYRVEGSPPSVTYHRPIPAAQLAAFRTAIGLPAGFSLAEVSLAEGDTPGYYLSLTAERLSGDQPGSRARWFTYVRDATNTLRVMVLEERKAGISGLMATFPLPPAPDLVYADRSWVGAHDLTYWRNGLADRVFYDGAFVNAQYIAVDPGTIPFADPTTWAAYAQPTPTEVWVRTEPADFAMNPLWNL